MNGHPPRLADRFLEWFCDPYLLEDLQGDLYELYESNLNKGRLKADSKYWWLVLRSFRWSALKKNRKLKNSGLMITKNNFRIAWRVLWRDRFNTSINLLGLTIGIACFVLLGLYVQQELSYDQFHSKKSRIYRSWLKEDYGEGQIFINSHTPLRFESFFEDNFPEVEKSVQYIQQTYLVGRGEGRINERVAIISPDFFEVFDFNIIEGNKQLLRSPDDIVLSQAYAKKYFGDLDPIGKSLAVQIGSEVRNFNVSSVFQDLPQTSSMSFEMAISTENNSNLFGERTLKAWFSVIAETYVLVKENASVASIEGKMQEVVLSEMGEAGYGDGPIQEGQYDIRMQPLTDIHLNPDVPLGNAPVANPQYVFILAAIGLLVLVIACINYTTLAVGQSLKRGREVGIRKVMGAHRGTLVYQYLSESILLGFMAMVIGVTIALFLIPTFNTLTGTAIFYAFHWWHAFVFLGIGLIIGIISGIYPALILSGFKTIKILQGNLKLGKLTLRKSLVVFQFLITVFLISTTLVIQKQVKFLQSKDLGIDYEAVISTQLYADPAADRISQRIATAMENGQLLKSKLEQNAEISKIAMGTHVFGTSGWANLAYTDDKGVFRWFRLLVVDAHYLDAFGISMKEGRAFEEGNGLDLRQSVILNEKAVAHFGLEDPIGKKLPGSEFGDHQIIGVAEDFHFSSLHTEIEPLVIVQNIIPIVTGVSDGDIVDSITPKLVFTYSGSDLTKATEILKREWESVFPNESWNFNFIDEQIKSQYENEARMNRLIAVATFLSILIAALGLLGLSLLVVNSKVKEIGIRKVLGASIFSIFRLLAKDFSIQIVIAIILSVPLTVVLMNEWLENFAYRTDIGVGLFIVSGVVSMLVAVMVISYHTLRAAKVNPVQSLRTE